MQRTNRQPRPSMWLVVVAVALAATGCSGAAAEVTGSPATSTTGADSVALGDEATTTAVTAAVSTTTGAPTAVDIAERCQPATAASDLSSFAEAKADTVDGIGVWAFFYSRSPIPAGDPIVLDEVTETKILWRITGEGTVAISAVGPGGILIEPSEGPTHHLGSNWKRPGEQWGTGWRFPEPGCWTFLVRRGDGSAEISVEVTF